MTQIFSFSRLVALPTIKDPICSTIYSELISYDNNHTTSVYGVCARIYEKLIDVFEFYGMIFILKKLNVFTLIDCKTSLITTLLLLW